MSGSQMQQRKEKEMPRGPRGEKRPADVIGAAVMVGKIATGEIEEKPQTKSGRVLFWSVFLILGALVASPQRYLWAATEGATHPPVGTIPHFERGKAPPGFEEPEPAPIVLAEARKQAKRGAYAAIAAFDGRWSVVIGTRSGPCDPQYRFGVRIINGNITYEGGGAANAQGRVSPNGSVTVSVASGPNAASGQGRLTRDYGTGAWRGQGPGGACSGAWQAWRQ